MEVVIGLHGRVAIAIVLYLTIVGIWGLGLGLRGRGPTPNFVGSLVIAEIAVVVQGLFGVASLFDRAPANGVHILYGFALAVAIPLAATLVRHRPPRAISFAFGFMALFAAGLAIRGITTAG